jgi:TolB protein
VIEKVFKNRALLIFVLVILATTLFCPAPCHTRVYIDITAPHLRQIPTAIPLFKRLDTGTEQPELPQTIADLLQETLVFTGFFKALDRGAFLEVPQEAGLMQHTINFKNWTDIGAELLIKGGFTFQNGLLRIELRLFDTFSGRLLVGKRYTGSLKDQRRMIHRFSNDVVQQLTGHEGIFNTKIAFVSSNETAKEIFICDFDGYAPRQFTDTGTITLFPSWSSDGKWLAYTDYNRGKPDLYIRNIEEKRGSVTAFKGSSITPAWVPGQFTLAASLSHEGNPSLYLLTGEGRIIKKLTRHWGIDVSPTWSPDGKFFAFVSNRSGTPQIYVKNMEDGKVRRLTFEGNYNTTPQWSPRGDFIAYSGMVRGEGTNVYIISVDGAHRFQLTHGSGSNESPTWSPDGTMIAFSSNREGKSRIYVMNANGANQRRLIDLPGEQSDPAWSPRLTGY